MQRNIFAAIFLVLILSWSWEGPWEFSIILAETSESITQDTQEKMESNNSSGDKIPGPELETLELLSKYLAEAALNNPGLEAAFLRWKAALEKVLQVKALPDPRFTFGYYVQSVETRVGPQNARVALSQTFPWFGSLSLKGDMTLNEANSLKAEYDLIKLKLFYEVKTLFFESAYLFQAVDLTRQGLELLKYLDNVVRARYATGSSSHAEVLRLRVQLGQLEDRLRTLEDQKKPLRAKLASTLNTTLNDSFPLPRLVPVMLSQLSDQELLDQLFESNPQLRKLGYLKDRDKAAVKLAHKSGYPDITLGLENIVTDTANNPFTEDSGKDAVIASISLNFPLWRKKIRGGVTESVLKQRATIKEEEALRQSLISELQLVSFKYREAQRKIDLYLNTLIPTAEESFSVSLKSFQTGRGYFSDLIETQRILLELDLSYVRALADQAQRFAELELLLGKEIPCQIHGAVIPGQESLTVFHYEEINKQGVQK